MKNNLILNAEYNRFANANMLACLGGLDKEILYKKCGLFYENIAGVLGHIIDGEVGIFINNFGKFSDKKLEFGEIKYNKNDFFSLQSALKAADNAIISIIKNTSDFNKNEILEFPGIKFSHSRAFLMQAILHHSTHHRGQIAGALDILGIQNDFNGMLGMKI